MIRKTLSAAAVLGALAIPALAEEGPAMSQAAKTWSGYCLSSGVCAISSGDDSGAGLLLFRDWPAEAEAYLCYQPSPGQEVERWTLTIDGAQVLDSSRATPLSPSLTQAAKQGAAMSLGAFARHLAQSGAPLCASPLAVTPDLAARLAAGREAKVRSDSTAGATVSLFGFTALAKWLDERQQRTTGTTGALLQPGGAAAQAAPHAAVIETPSTLPAAVREAWSTGSLQCAEIDDPTFAALDAVEVELDAGERLFLLPCNRPGNNALYVAVTQGPDGTAKTQPLPMKADGQATADPGGYNLRWDGRNDLLVSTLSQGYACQVTRTWRFAGAGFAVEQVTESSGC